MEYYDYYLNEFSDTINEYDLQPVKLSEECVLLVSSNYALLFTIHFDNIYVEYIYESENKLFSLDISSFVASKFDEVDREGIISPQGLKETILAIIKIQSRGISRHFKTLLSGDLVAWITDYQEFELSKQPREVPMSKREILKKFFC